MTAPFLAVPGLTAPAPSPSFPTKASVLAGDSRCVTACAVSSFSLKLHFSRSQHGLDRSGAQSPFPARRIHGLAIPSSTLSKVKPAMRGPLFPWGRDVGPADFGRCLWNFLKRREWQESQQRGETVSFVFARASLSFLGVPQGCAIPAVGCTVPTECTPRLHWPFWLSPEASPAPMAVPQAGREKGTLPGPSPCHCRIWGHPHPPCPPEPRVASRTCCLIQALSPAGLPSRQGAACHCGLSHRAAAQRKMTRFPLLFLSRQG